MSDTVIRVENVSKLYRLGEVGTGSLAHDVNRWWHRVRGKEDSYLKIGEVNDRTKSVSSVQRPESSAKKGKLTTTEHRGRCEMEQSQIGPKGEGVGATESKDTERGAGVNQGSDSAKFLEGHSQTGSQMDSEKPASIRSANASSGSGQKNGSDSESAKISEISGRSSENFNLKPENSMPQAQSEWVYALKDVSFEVKCGELRPLGRSEKEISKKCLGATKVPDSERSRHQLMGIIGRNGAARKARGRQDYKTAVRRTGEMTPVNQAEGQPLGRLPEAARGVRRRVKARIKSTLLKILSRVTTQSEGRIKVRGRIASLLEVGTGFHPILTIQTEEFSF